MLQEMLQDCCGCECSVLKVPFWQDSCAFMELCHDLSAFVAVARRAHVPGLCDGFHAHTSC